MLDAQSPPRPPYLAPWRPWAPLAPAIRAYFFTCPLLDPLIELTRLRERSLTLAIDAAGLTATYWPRSVPGLVMAFVAERGRDWWIPPVPGEDHALYLATRLAAELRAAWDGRVTGNG